MSFKECEHAHAYVHAHTYKHTPKRKKRTIKPIHSDKVETVVTTVAGAIDKDGAPGTCHGPGNIHYLDQSSRHFSLNIL